MLQNNTQTPRLRISHAFHGFIYLPLFLAKARYLPEDIQLKNSGSDDLAIRELLLPDPVTRKRSEFAVCDPIAVENLGMIYAEHPIGDNYDKPIVIATLIRQAPVWIFCPENSSKPVAQIKQLKGIFNRLRYYESPNTGYFLGSLVKDILGPNLELREVSFENEAKEQLSRHEITVSSNILWILKQRFTNNDFVFSFPSKSPHDPDLKDLHPLFFTGIVTRESFLKAHIFEVIQILTAIKKAVHDILAPGANLAKIVDDCFPFFENNLLLQFGEKLEIDRAKKLMVDAIKILKDEKIYPMHVFEPELLGWKNSVLLRRRFMPSTWEPPNFHEFSYPFPEIILRPGWFDRILLRSD